ncbi:MAG: hypothetical protein AAF483_23405 [Planctomycetota bacterium]
MPEHQEPAEQSTSLSQETDPRPVDSLLVSGQPPKQSLHSRRSFSFRTLLLLCLCASTWIALAVYNQKLEQERHIFYRLAEENIDLLIEDPTMVAMRAYEHPLDQRLSEDVHIKFYIPPNHSYRVCVAPGSWRGIYDRVESSEWTREVTEGLHTLRIPDPYGRETIDGKPVPPKFYVDDELLPTKINRYRWASGSPSYEWYGGTKQVSTQQKYVFLFCKGAAASIWLEPISE